jgi:ABC-type multidrug transport system fused ATPase/permease subunit
LVLDSVWLNYQQAKGFKADGQFALKGVSLTIRKGEKVAFCGRYL